MVKGEQNHRKAFMPMDLAGKKPSYPIAPKKMTIVHLYIVASVLNPPPPKKKKKKMEVEKSAPKHPDMRLQCKLCKLCKLYTPCSLTHTHTKFLIFFWSLGPNKTHSLRLNNTAENATEGKTYFIFLSFKCKIHLSFQKGQLICFKTFKKKTKTFIFRQWWSAKP